MQIDGDNNNDSIRTESAQPSRASANGSAAALPAPISYDEWLALGPEKAAEYTAARMGYDEDRKRKLVLILQAFWNETTPNND